MQIFPTTRRRCVSVTVPRPWCAGATSDYVGSMPARSRKSLAASAVHAAKKSKVERAEQELAASALASVGGSSDQRAEVPLPGPRWAVGAGGVAVRWPRPRARRGRAADRRVGRARRVACAFLALFLVVRGVRPRVPPACSRSCRFPTMCRTSSGCAQCPSRAGACRRGRTGRQCPGGLLA